MFTNRLNGKRYIGQTIHEKERYRAHTIAITRKPDSPIDIAIAKYGIDNFDYEVLIRTSGKLENVKVILDTLECFYIKRYSSKAPNGYNLTDGGFGSAGREPWNKGKQWSEEVKKKLSDSHKGKTPWIKGRHHTEESKQKMSVVAKGRAPWNKGLTKDDLRVNKYVETRKGKGFKLPPEFYEKLRKLNTGRIIVENPIVQMDKEGNVVKSFANPNQAIKEGWSRHIYDVLAGKRNYCQGYVWKWKSQS